MASFTSVSLISTSPWYGPGSSPIISPSRWQTQVLDNVCVLALHDHSGSAGEGSSQLASNQVDFGGMREAISPFFPSASTDWSIKFDSAWPGAGNVSTSTNGASITYDVYLNPGTRTVRFFYGTGSANGIITGCISGGSVTSASTSFDAYSSGAESPPTGSNALTNRLGTFQFRVYTANEFSASGSAVTGSLYGSGRFQLMFKVSGSNASSTGYIFRLGYMEIT